MRIFVVRKYQNYCISSRYLRYHPAGMEPKESCGIGQVLFPLLSPHILSTFTSPSLSLSPYLLSTATLFNLPPSLPPSLSILSPLLFSPLLFSPLLFSPLLFSPNYLTFSLPLVSYHLSPLSLSLPLPSLLFSPLTSLIIALSKCYTKSHLFLQRLIHYPLRSILLTYFYFPHPTITTRCLFVIVCLCL